MLIGLLSCRSETNTTVAQQAEGASIYELDRLAPRIKTDTIFKEARQPVSSSCFSDMQKALLCRCLYSNLAFSTQGEGSLNMYVQMSEDFSIDEFDSLSLELLKYVELNQFNSFNGSSLAIGECIEAVLLLGEDYKHSDQRGANGLNREGQTDRNTQQHE